MMRNCKVRQKFLRSALRNSGFSFHRLASVVETGRENAMSRIEEINMTKKMESLKRDQLKQLTDILRTLEGRFGTEVINIVSEMVAEKTEKFWARTSRRFPDKSIDTLLHIMWEPLENEGYDFSIERTDRCAQIYCTKCPVYDLAKELKVTDLAYIFHCLTDPFKVRGFNDKIGYRRTKTLMEGDEYCDHYYFMKGMK